MAYNDKKTVDKKTKQYIDDLFTQMEKDKSSGKENVYNEVLNTIIYPNLKKRDELVNELYIQFVTNKNISKAINEGYFKYLFIIAAKGQVHSNTSPFHKHARKSAGDVCFDSAMDNYYVIDERLTDEQEMDLEYKIQKEEQNKKLKAAMKKVKMDYFEATMMELYFDNNKTFREIGKEFDINHSLVFQTVQKVLERIKKQIKQSNNGSL